MREKSIPTRLHLKNPSETGGSPLNLSRESNLVLGNASCP